MRNMTGYKYVVQNNGTFTAMVNRTHLYFYKSGFKTAKEAHEYAVKRIGRFEKEHPESLIRNYNGVKKTVLTREQIEANKREVRSSKIEVFICKECGESYYGSKPERCTKCLVFRGFDSNEVSKYQLIKPEPESYWEAI